jgi:cytochrome c oxidase assembly factor CtaG
MHPLVRGLLGPWEPRFEVLIPLLVFGALYTAGWLRLRRQSKRQKLATKWRLASYYGGLGFLALALLSPIDWLGTQLLLMHMIQHKILVMLAAPLLWLGSPFPIALWAFSPGPRRSLTQFFTRRSPLRTALGYLASPAVAFLGLVFVYLAWHDPTLYNLALTHEWVHNVEHLSFFVAAMLFWWPVTNAAPRLHKAMPYWGRILFVMAFVPPNAIAGFVIANSSDVIYTYYNSVPRLWGLTALEDQAWGGGIMWLFSSEMMIDVALIMLGVMFYRERRQKANLEKVQQIRDERAALRVATPQSAAR